MFRKISISPQLENLMTALAKVLDTNIENN